ncbi:MAG: hypothetical protein AMXMBFR13_05980 [Phycisphaerae bacterium]
MFLSNPFQQFALGDLFDTVLPDLVLAFAFFTSVIYAVLSRRFGEQRPAVAMSAALGGALSIGLVWWEYVNGLSIRNLGPIAVGFAIIILGGVMYQSIRGIGGTWAGAGIALGASLLVGWTLGLDWPVDRDMVRTVIMVTLTVGILAFLLHRRGHSYRAPRGRPDLGEIRHDMSDLDKDRRVSRRLGKNLRHLKRDANRLYEHPEDAKDIMLQLNRMLPAEGWLTDRMARLREKAHFVCKGQVARIEEVQEHVARLPPAARTKAARELGARYKELQLDQRLERLDRAVAENERRIREITGQAEAYLARDDHRGLVDVLDRASKLQRHNEKLFKLIDRTESRLIAAARQTAKQSGGVNRA